MHKNKTIIQADNLSQLIELSLQNAEQIKEYTESLAEVKARQDIILVALNSCYQAPTKTPKNSHTRSIPSEKEMLDFNPLVYIEDKGLLTLSEYEDDRNFIQEVIENYQRLGLVEYKTCIHNILVRVSDTRREPINNMRAYIKSSLNKHNARK